MTVVWVLVHSPGYIFHSSYVSLSGCIHADAYMRALVVNYNGYANDQVTLMITQVLCNHIILNNIYSE
jgi:hypothetical protein